MARVFECAGVVDHGKRYPFGHRKRRAAGKTLRHLLRRLARTRAEPRFENMRRRFDVNDQRLRIAHQRLMRPFERKQAVRRPRFEFFGRQRDVVLAIAGGTRDIAMREHDWFARHLFAREAEQRILARAGRPHDIDQLAAHRASVRAAWNGRRCHNTNGASGVRSTNSAAPSIDSGPSRAASSHQYVANASRSFAESSELESVIWKRYSSNT